MLKKQQNFSNKKSQQKLHEEILQRKSYKLPISISGINFVGQSYALLFLPDQVPQFVNELIE